MATYLSPGVYVEQVPSAIQPIAGVGTSTAGFIGIVSGGDTTIQVPKQTVYSERVGVGDKTTTDFTLKKSPVGYLGNYQFSVGGVPRDATVSQSDATVATVHFTDIPEDKLPITGTYVVVQPFTILVSAKTPHLCTSFSDFTSVFGDFSLNEGQRRLAHAVYGFFNNGGTRCYVIWVGSTGDIEDALAQFEPIDEIAIVAAPGVLDLTAQRALYNHCVKLQNRVAIIDGLDVLPTPPDFTTEAITQSTSDAQLGTSDYAALYFPWINVYDPIIGKPVAVPPSGHIAGIYARVDAQRGVHKAPANEVILGATGVAYRLTSAQQAGLNPDGINVIRDFNGNITVWGARTLGGDANGEMKYINVRRLMIFLAQSIEQGTQWVVFEPNDATLWAKIARNVTAFLTLVWRSGALFGATAQQAFYVKCDAETNPPDVRDAGQVVTEIGVAVTKPAEFVIFRISQWAGLGQ